MLFRFPQCIHFLLWSKFCSPMFHAVPHTSKRNRVLADDVQRHTSILTEGDHSGGRGIRNGNRVRGRWHLLSIHHEKRCEEDTDERWNTLLQHASIIHPPSNFGK